MRALSMGVYTLAADADDPQKPVEPGTIAYVPAGISHHFHTITRELTALVFFALAEGPALAGERH